MHVIALRLELFLCQRRWAASGQFIYPQ